VGVVERVLGLMEVLGEKGRFRYGVGV